MTESKLMRVHVDFEKLVKRASQENGLTASQVTRLIPKIIEGREVNVIIKSSKRGRKKKTFLDGLV